MPDDAVPSDTSEDDWRQPWAVAEVFAGAGSVAQGFARAAGFQVAYLNDIDEYARRTYRVNYGTSDRYDLLTPAR